MSGIVGLWWLDGRPVKRRRLMQAMDAMTHRGPHGSNVYIEGSIGLGHQLLRTTPEDAHPNQPLSRGPFTLTADARVDNRKELHAQLTRGIAKDASDAEFILSAYEAWNTAAPERLIGDYSFAVWDRKRRAFVCARDPLGVRPFYYCFSPGKYFAFASEVNALLALGIVSPVLDEEMVALYLSSPQLYTEESKRTTIKGIYKLQRNSVLTIDSSGRTTLQSIWSPTGSTLRLRDNDEYAAAFKEVFTKAVEVRLRSQGSVGSMLSGGLDSSSITCLARTVAPKEQLPIHTYSAIYPDLVQESAGAIDEREYINEVAALENIVPRYIRADKSGPFHDFDHIVKLYGQLYFGGNSFFHWQALQMCRGDNVRVLLDGTDGDSVVSHGRRFVRHTIQEWQWDAYRRAVGIEQDPSIHPWEYFNHYGGWDILDTMASRGEFINHWKMAISAADAHGMRPWEMMAGPGASFRTFVTAPFRTWFDANFLRTGETQEDNRTLSSSFLAVHRDFLEHRLQSRASSLRGSSNLDRRWDELGQFQHMMETLDVLAAFNGVEMRYPFFDRRVIDFCLSLPGLQQRQDGFDRFVLRNAMRGILPEKIRERRRKANLSSGFDAGFRSLNHGFVEDAISSQADVLAKFVSVPEVLEIQQQMSGSSAAADQYSLEIYRVVSLACWLRNF